jgi:SsrA-binding protein
MASVFCMPLAVNPKARHSFDLIEQFEGGLVLTGAEVKATMQGNANIKGAFVTLRNGELWLRNAYIGHYTPSGPQPEGAERRDRKILVHKNEIRTLIMRHEAERLTMIPLDIHLSGRRIKLSFALARGKRKHEKRASIKKREVDREIRRALKN